MRLEKQKSSKNFEDHTTPWQQFIKERFHNFLIKTGVAYKDTEDYLDVAPFIRPLNAGEDASGVTQSWVNIELTPEEAKLIDKGMTHRDILLLRGYKNLPKMVGK